MNVVVLHPRVRFSADDIAILQSVIFSVTLVLTVMIIASSPGTKNIAAQ